MAFVDVHPKYRDWLAEAGLSSAADFLACAGEPVCVREDRRVDRVMIGPMAAYLKKETTIRLRERISSWWSGYGWASKSVREGMVLEELASADVAAPMVLALGEENGQAFVLIRAETDVEPLDTFARRRPESRPRMASLLGRELARMHDAGFYHPDLFAKHVLVGQADGLDRVCLIDWQRTRHVPEVSWSRRAFDLATLDASLDQEAITVRDRLRFLSSYLRGATDRRPSLRTLVQIIRGRAWWLKRQRRILRQRHASVAPPTSVPSPTTAPSSVPGPNYWHEWHDCPLRLTEPSLPVLPVVEILRWGVDVDRQRHRAALISAGRALRALHEAGYRPDPGLESWMVHAPAAGEVEIVLTSVADLTPTLDRADQVAIDDLAHLFVRHGSRLDASAWMSFLRGYLGSADSRTGRRDLVRRIRAHLDAREPAR